MVHFCRKVRVFCKKTRSLLYLGRGIQVSGVLIEIVQKSDKYFLLLDWFQVLIIYVAIFGYIWAVFFVMK